jgi:hypothetical protein
MRYVVAMVFAVIGTGLASFFMSSEIANWAVNHMSFESPDDADSMHMLVYMGGNVAGLIVGWLVGWFVSGAGSTGNQPT